MSSSFGQNLHITIFGQSHSEAIGVVLDGLPAGEAIDLAELQNFLARRAPGRSAHATARKEADKPEILAGLAGGVTCGAPFAAIIRNENARPTDYEKLADTPRPGHADLTAQLRYNGFQDKSGGGHFSGRLTAPLCIAGGICKQILERRGVQVFARIAEIGGIEDEGELLAPLADPADAECESFPTCSRTAGERMKQRIAEAKAAGDSVGGIVECVATGFPAGIGDPMFDGLENRIAQIVFGIPAVKGVEFGEGFGAARLFGSENNDAFTFGENGRVISETNHAGGILGGISTGMPIVVRAAFKPTPSIAKPQKTVDFKTGQAAVIEIEGRHDPCIVPRAVPAVEAAVALALLDALLGAGSLPAGV